jgi:radical SAM protein with 4Fe4S-binding SPASM domain
MLEIIDKHHTRKYFCTNGMNLKKIRESIFKYKVDVFAVSVDGATQETNARIRRGSDLDSIVHDLKSIVNEKRVRGLNYPYINFVFCAMKSNIAELPDLVRLAAQIGLDEVKVVYLTVFNDELLQESLWGEEDLIRKYFTEAERLGEELGVLIKLPHLIGEDIAGDKCHKDCFVTWRDFFLGSDGYVRPCMSTPVKFLKYDNKMDFMDIWNCEEYQRYRASVNDNSKMGGPCKRCYQSSHCNWNKKESFIQIGENFSPDWGK